MGTVELALLGMTWTLGVVLVVRSWLLARPEPEREPVLGMTATSRRCPGDPRRPHMPMSGRTIEQR